MEYCGNPMEYCGNPMEYCGNPMEYCGNPMEYCGHPMEYCGNPMEYCGNPMEYCGNPMEYCGNPMEYCCNPMEYCGNSMENCGNPMEYCGNPMEYCGNPMEYRGNPIEYCGNPMEYCCNPMEYCGNPMEYCGNLMEYCDSNKLLPYFKFLVADFNDSLVSSASLPCLAILSDHYPDMFCEFIDKLSMIVERQPYHVHYVDKIFTNVANLNEKEARRILTNCLVQFKAVDESYYPAVFTCIKEIGVKYPKVLTNYSSAIQALGSTNGTQNYVQCLLNFLDGTSSEPDFYKIKERSQPNSAVSRIKHQSPETRQSHEVNNKPIIIKKTVPVNPQKVQSKVNKPEKTNKGVTTAPEWCNKLSSLLNKPSDSDWRFLAVYLGYASDNIKLLSEMDNPSLCLFNDWYTSHKGREATYAVYKALQVIGRNDCMQTIDSSIPPKDPLIPENEKLIDICISYHTDDQVDANVLKFHLELAGFQCWMFTGTTLHLDTLYHVVDEAMRSADVVLCMCSRVYVNSRTCCKQANLAQQLNKPIIPVIIGPLSWPPPGPMSAIYCQFPCVQLYEFSANNQSGRKYWPHSNFVDLLAKICYHTSPNVDKITKEEYRNWIHNIESFPENSEKTVSIGNFFSCFNFTKNKLS
ncbi:uncharacterized protein LOC102803728 [Saccoglossus kowalevskii]